MKERWVQLQIYVKREQTEIFTLRNCLNNNSSNNNVIPCVYVTYEWYNVLAHFLTGRACISIG